jgi:hypothetical protein
MLLSLTATGARAAGTGGRGDFVNGVRDTGQYLPDDFVIARVGERAVRVYDYRESYFLVDPQVRSASDSLGRAEFLTNMVKKDVLGLTAQTAGYTLNFEDRATLRNHRATLLANRLFELAVLDVPKIPDDSLRKVYPYYGWEQRMRMLFFSDRAQAEASRLALVRGTRTWGALAAKYTPPALQSTNGEITWSKFENLPSDLGLQLWALKPGEISQVIVSATGYQLVQVVERRPRAAPSYEVMKPMISSVLRSYSADQRRRAIQTGARDKMGVQYDTTNVRWASALYKEAVKVGSEGLGQNIVIDETVPDFSEQDTARTIARWPEGRLSLGDVAHSYSDLPAVLRPPINTPERFMDYADAVIVAPRMVDLAIERGMDKDSMVVEMFNRKREEILVTKMVEDSCFSRIFVPKDERRAYYQKNLQGFVTFPAVRYAVVVRDTKAEADSVKARLDAHESIESVLRADSLRGELRSGIKEANTNDHISMQKLLFEEMRPGQRIVAGPDKEKNFACIQLLSFDPGHQLPFEQVEGMIDESLRNIKAEQALNAFFERLKKRYPIEAHYELLMRIRLTVPSDNNGL